MFIQLLGLLGIAPAIIGGLYAGFLWNYKTSIRISIISLAPITLLFTYFSCTGFFFGDSPFIWKEEVEMWLFFLFLHICCLFISYSVCFTIIKIRSKIRKYKK